jgi:hypothetical protein
LKFKLSLPIAIAALALLAATGAIIYAFTVATNSVPTGAFTIGAENTSLEVKMYNISTTEVFADWCARPTMAVGDIWKCSASIKNLKTAGNVNVSLHPTAVNATGTAGLKDLMFATVKSSTNVPLNNCSSFDGPILQPSTTLAAPVASLGFGDATPGAQAGDIVLAPGEKAFICFEYAYPTPTAPTLPVFAASITSVAWLVSGDDGP